jgi:light-regulated signal transduction histidine kinase (bacteriophytochrome)
MLQYSKNDMLGKQSPAIIHLPTEVEKRGKELSERFGKPIEGFDVFVELTKQGHDETREWTYVRKDGSQLSVLLTVTALRNEHNEIVNFLGMAVDISERTENQKKLLVAKQELELLTKKLTSQNEQLANFAHITSHNLRSPVSNLDALLQLHKESTDEEERTELFDKFEIVINHLSSTLNSLIEAIKIRELSINDQCENNFSSILEKTKQMVSAQIMAAEANIESDFDNAPSILYNQHYLESIFLNLLTNAVKYKSPSSRPHIRFTTSKREGRVILKVEDNGLGIDLKRHGNKLFGLHKTFHRHPEARGVGLYLTKTQVEAMGGSIYAQSELGIGTTFNVKF